MRFSFVLLALGVMLQFPLAVPATDIAGAAKVVASADVPDHKRAAVNYWTDVPSATKDDAAARDMIVRHIDDLVPALSARARPQEALKGVVTIIDEQNDRMTVRLTSDATADFKVQDGLIFDSIRRGDPVEIIVENIDGTKTIVGLKKD